MRLVNTNLIYSISIFTTISILFFGCSSCNSNLSKPTADSNLNIEYYKNLQANVKGYLTQGFNKLPMDIVKKTDCFKISKNDKGQIVEVEFVIKNKRENSYLYGFSVKKISYTDSSIQTKIFDKYGKQLAQGKPSKENTIFIKEIMLKDGNPYGERGLDIFGNSMKGFSEKRFDCDDAGKIIWEWSVDNFERQLDYANGSNVLFKKYKYNENNLLAETGFYKNRNAKVALGGIHAVQYEYNKNGNIVQNKFIDTMMNLQPDPNSGMAYRVMEYNDFGNMTKQTLLDKNGNMVNNISGYAMQESKFDQFTNNTLSLYFAANDKSVVNTEIGAHGERFVYDEKGDLVLKEYVDENIKLTNSTADGYAYQAMEYNDSGWLVSETYFNKNNTAAEPIWFKAHQKLNTYYNNGMLQQTEYFDGRNNHAVIESCACSAVVFKYDSIGNVIEETYLNAQGKPTKEGKQGIASRHFRYDVFGDVLLMELYDASGNEITINGNRSIQ